MRIGTWNTAGRDAARVHLAELHVDIAVLPEWGQVPMERPDAATSFIEFGHPVLVGSAAANPSRMVSDRVGGSQPLSDGERLLVGVGRAAQRGAPRPVHGWKRVRGVGFQTDIADAATDPAARYRTVADAHGQLSESPTTRSQCRITSGVERCRSPSL